MYKPETMNRIIIIAFIAFIASCTFVQKVQDGDTAFERKQYAKAVEMLRKEYSKEKSRVQKGKIAYKLAQSYTALNNHAAAIDWYKTAFDGGAGLDALKGYAFALKKNEQYKEAQANFKELGIEIGSPYEYRKEISACKIAAQWKEDAKKSNYIVQNMEWNSSKSDYAPTLFENQQIVFTSDRNAATGEETYNWTNNSFSDLFVVNPSLDNVRQFPNPINSTNNDGTATFNEDFTEMVFTRCFNQNKYQDKYCQLMSSTLEDGNWTSPKVLNFIQSDINYGHPSLTKDGSQLYFSCNDPEGWGGFDIWVSTRTPDGWSMPDLLSRSINTVGDEKFPNIDGDTLYFSSDNHTGMGGLDIYKTYKFDDTNWVPVQNLKAPINSGADDFGFVIDYEAQLNEDQLQVGYFTSNRMNGQGLDDIYRFEKRVPPPVIEPPVTEKEEPKEIVYQLNLTGYVVEKIYKIPENPNSKVLGKRPISNAKVDIKIGSDTQTVTTSSDGKFELELDYDTDYYFFGSKDGYLNSDERFSTRGIAKDPNNPIQEYEVEILLEKIFKDQEIVLENIYYDFDKWDIRKDAEPSLNNLVKILNQNPTLNIQLSSHTDCQGNPNYNQTLSQRRAQSAVNYLINAGIQDQRLTAVGYGENSLLIDCVCQRCTEAEHQANRRTTFKIVD